MPHVTYHNTNIFYITNALNNNGNLVLEDSLKHGEKIAKQFTGWHYIPVTRWDNWLVNRQFYDLFVNHNKFRLVSTSVTLQNLIPLTDQLSINQETTFMSYNNTVYAICYEDKSYETQFKESRDKLTNREGCTLKQTTTGATIDEKMVLPLYYHYLPTKFETPDWKALNMYFWDPFTKANALKELRPGKNSITFGWNASSADSDKWYTTSEYMFNYLTDDGTNKGMQEDTIEDIRMMWITPGSMHRQDPRSLLGTQKNIHNYKYLWHKPINQCFIKMLPIIGKNKQLLKHEAQIVVYRSITFEVTPRIGCINYPQLSEWYTAYSTVWRKTGDDLENNKWSAAYRPMENTGQFPPYKLDSPANNAVALELKFDDISTLKRNETLTKALPIYTTEATDKKL